MTQERSLIGFAVRKFRRSWNIWTSNKNRANDIFSSCSIRFTSLRMSHAKNFAGDKRKREWKSGLKPGIHSQGHSHISLLANEIFDYEKRSEKCWCRSEPFSRHLSLLLAVHLRQSLWQCWRDWRWRLSISHQRNLFKSKQLATYARLQNQLIMKSQRKIFSLENLPLWTFWVRFSIKKYKWQLAHIRLQLNFGKT